MAKNLVGQFLQVSPQDEVLCLGLLAVDIGAHENQDRLGGGGFGLLFDLSGQEASEMIPTCFTKRW